MKRITILALGLLLLFPVMTWAASGGGDVAPRQYLTAADSVTYYYLADDDDYANVSFLFSITSVSTDDSCYITLEEGGWGSDLTDSYYWISVDTLGAGGSGSFGDTVYTEKVTLTNKLTGVRIKVEWVTDGTAPYAITWGYRYVYHNKY